MELMQASEAYLKTLAQNTTELTKTIIDSIEEAISLGKMSTTIRVLESYYIPESLNRAENLLRQKGYFIKKTKEEKYFTSFCVLNISWNMEKPYEELYEYNDSCK